MTVSAIPGLGQRRAVRSPRGVFPYLLRRSRALGHFGRRARSCRVGQPGAFGRIGRRAGTLRIGRRQVRGFRFGRRCLFLGRIGRFGRFGRYHVRVTDLGRFGRYHVRLVR